MSDVEEKLVLSLSGSGDTAILPYLPYLLQDLWELGSIPEDMVRLLRDHGALDASSRVLDLACGKGAAAVAIAKAFGCQVKGIDLMEDFIQDARHRAKEHGVGDRVTFAVADINRAVRDETGYDATILGAVGDVLGDPSETLSLLRETVRPGGLILIDDGYCEDHDEDPVYHTRSQWLAWIRDSGLAILEEAETDLQELIQIDRFNQAHIEQRADELIETYPDDAELFHEYVRRQQEECDDIEQRVTSVVWVLQRR